MRGLLLASLCGCILAAGTARAQMPKDLAKGDMTTTPLGVPVLGDPLLPSVAGGLDGRGLANCGLCFWANMEYLYWSTSKDNLPPLVTTSPVGSAGVIGQPGTQVLFGGQAVNDPWRSGARANLGVWFNDAQTCGLEVGGFWLQPGSNNFAAGSGGSPVLSRPFFNVLTGTQDAQLVAFPGVLAGGVTVRSSSEFWGAEANFRHQLCGGCNWRLDGLVGYRYLNLTDSVNINESLTAGPLAAPVAPGTFIGVADSFHTRNQFHGGQLGLAGQYWSGPWQFGVTGKVALGVNLQDIDINGSTTTVAPGGTAVVNPGGLLAQTSNIGSYSRNSFGVVPEVDLRVGYQLCSRVTLYAGYSCLFWNSVSRAGDQIDTGVNTNLIPPAGAAVGPLRPAFTDHQTNFWAHGANVGILFKF